MQRPDDTRCYNNACLRDNTSLSEETNLMLGAPPLRIGRRYI